MKQELCRKRIPKERYKDPLHLFAFPPTVRKGKEIFIESQEWGEHAELLSVEPIRGVMLFSILNISLKSTFEFLSCFTGSVGRLMKVHKG